MEKKGLVVLKHRLDRYLEEAHGCIQAHWLTYVFVYNVSCISGNVGNQQDIVSHKNKHTKNPKNKEKENKKERRKIQTNSKQSTDLV